MPEPVIGGRDVPDIHFGSCAGAGELLAEAVPFVCEDDAGSICANGGGAVMLWSPRAPVMSTRSEETLLVAIDLPHSPLRSRREVRYRATIYRTLSVGLAATIRKAGTRGRQPRND